MCGHYTLTDPEAIPDRFRTSNHVTGFSATTNARPGQNLPVITRQETNSVSLMRWGLIPHWADDPNLGFRMINARAETLAERPAFRALLSQNRCLVPADGFYERAPDRQDHLFQLRKRQLFSLAGLFTTWQPPSGEPVASYTIITVPANSTVAPIHDRMPVVLDTEDEEAWLDPKHRWESLRVLLRPAAAGLLTAEPVAAPRARERKHPPTST